MTREVIDRMMANKYGQILNVSSIAGIEPSGDWGVYTATKYAVRGFTDSLKKEFEDKAIKVMGFYPGGMNTEIFKTAGFDSLNEPWMMDVNEAAEIVVFMLTRSIDVSMDHVEVRKKIV
ncbi:MAG: SDR family NAD(P)-dependent oxidoreductase [Candidatus Dojkabacteria bacterium]|nr:SDR family NAD(P)-dependent oxidoreductase [Candidatus Dojkabacteria bacterium]MDQ7021893.1 SDR family NAD(P)-dependent oxidoreductase [Candidatus Dojkabacteria bacterium]